MHTPARILRAQAEDLPGGRQSLSTREVDRQNRILAAGTAFMAEHGRHTITLANFAVALQISPGSIRRHFPDLDNLLSVILSNHLMSLARALGAVPQDTPCLWQARRAAYLAATRGPLGALTAVHLLLVRDRHLLPPDERRSIEGLRLSIGYVLAGESAHLALAVLDTPEIDPAQAEQLLAEAPRVSFVPPARQPMHPGLHQVPMHGPEPMARPHPPSAKARSSASPNSGVRREEPGMTSCPIPSAETALSAFQSELSASGATIQASAPPDPGAVASRSEPASSKPTPGRSVAFARQAASGAAMPPLPLASMAARPGRAALLCRTAPPIAGDGVIQWPHPTLIAGAWATPAQR